MDAWKIRRILEKYLYEGEPIAPYIGREIYFEDFIEVLLIGFEDYIKSLPSYEIEDLLRDKYKVLNIAVKDLLERAYYRI